jgi:hypothetical protein
LFPYAVILRMGANLANQIEKQHGKRGRIDLIMFT